MVDRSLSDLIEDLQNGNMRGNVSCEDCDFIVDKLQRLEAENETLKSNRIGEVRTVLIEELECRIERLKEVLSEIQYMCIGELKKVGVMTKKSKE